ncbi:hypothetical protein P4S63_19885 [Pseudoalteromonas sp. B193]
MALLAKYKQQVNGVEVFNREYNLLMDKEYNLVASSGYFADTSSSKNKLAALTGFVSSEQSIKAFSELANIDVSLRKIGNEGGYAKYEAKSLDDSKIVLGTPRAKEVFLKWQASLNLLTTLK